MSGMDLPSSIFGFLVKMVGFGLISYWIGVQAEGNNLYFHNETTIWSNCVFPDQSLYVSNPTVPSPALQKCLAIESKHDNVRTHDEIFLSQLCQTIYFVSNAICKTSPQGSDYRKETLENSLDYTNIDVCAYGSILKSKMKKAALLSYFVQGCDNFCKEDVEPLCRLMVSAMCQYGKSFTSTGHFCNVQPAQPIGSGPITDPVPSPGGSAGHTDEASEIQHSQSPPAVLEKITEGVPEQKEPIPVIPASNDRPSDVHPNELTGGSKPIDPLLTTENKGTHVSVSPTQQPQKQKNTTQAPPAGPPQIPTVKPGASQPNPIVLGSPPQDQGPLIPKTTVPVDPAAPSQPVAPESSKPDPINIEQPVPVDPIDTSTRNPTDTEPAQNPLGPGSPQPDPIHTAQTGPVNLLKPIDTQPAENPAEPSQKSNVKPGDAQPAIDPAPGSADKIITSTTALYTTSVPGQGRDNGLDDVDNADEHSLDDNYDVLSKANQQERQNGILSNDRADSIKKQENNVKTNEFQTIEENVPGSGHFFAYFLTAVVICISGYVIFHNKQKILAFIVEGRNGGEGGRRRGSGNIQYSKLKSNVEEVMPSLDKAATAKNFVY